MNQRPDEPELSDDELGGEEPELTAEEEQTQRALEALLRSPLVAGPDPSVIDDLLAEDDAEASPSAASAGDPTAELAETAKLDEQVAEIYAQILTRAPEHKVQPSTQRVVDCLDMMGNPQHQYRAIHITGTNGKTSTARMIEALLRERGIRTGRFTSPHLNSVRERISIDGQAISREGFIQAWQDVAPFVEMVDAQSAANGGPQMSFFEVFTVMAFAAFADAPVDVAVVEVGMGGLWDATNVIDADVAVLMTVARDHEKWLGAQLTDIAREKLGILKPGATLISAPQTPDVSELVKQAVAKNRATHVQYGKHLEVLEREPAVGGQMLTVRTPSAVYEDVPLAMYGKYQAENAAIALAAVEALFGGGAWSGDVVEHALMATNSPGRMEVIKNSPLVIADAAHNPAGVQATVEALDESFPGTRVLVFAAMADKDVEGMLSVLEPNVHSVVVTELHSERAMPIDEVAQLARSVFGEDRVAVEPHLDSAIVYAADVAESVDPEEVTTPSVIVMGSVILAAEARAVMGRPSVDEP
ncbi:bifunctional folylpolyglutamate synthase/dihydrofolate synthase [Trueperella bialowiezensis]|uniref:tetrahydrofolate synthase n=1 Tax=Trueperella bialowiezensis TaxID=312285 RepID=A0A3S4X4T2_9ACTO|nr:folylpolyglutamate synthase/dihydrofolate synthase family protein [Trueperella bialowiezensis]VEI12704.1 Folylpolyglutamate synthase [Trueperella bialowiezensis]